MYNVYTETIRIFTYTNMFSVYVFQFLRNKWVIDLKFGVLDVKMLYDTLC